MARILVADDDADIRELVELKLSALGHDVVSVGDGTAALAALRGDLVDLAVLDVMMPGLTGLELVAQMRVDDALASVPVILLTARAGENDVESGLSAGADDYVTKPFSPRELGQRVQSILTHRS